MPTKQLKGKRRAKEAGLLYVNSFDKGLSRRRCGNGFTYLTTTGKTVASERTRERIQSLAIPPAWEEVWICPKMNGHILARGVDDQGRPQYIYHERWQAISSATKFDRMHLMAELLPRIRRRVRKDLTAKALSRERVLAAVVRLLDKAHLRVGNERYTQERGSRGATTLASNHVEIEEFSVSLDFPAKSGKQRSVEFSDKKIAKVVQQCEELDGQYLFCYRDREGELRSVESTQVNEYLKEVTDEAVTAKDFRTWSGSVIALSQLKEVEKDLTTTELKKAINQAVATAADELGNTKAVCRSSYIHPGLLSTAEAGQFYDLLDKVGSVKSKPKAELTQDEDLFRRVLPHLEFN
ncbi:MAG: hypothetical protein RH917_02955 [Lacipirellulaceae bacterium]